MKINIKDGTKCFVGRRAYKYIYSRTDYAFINMVGNGFSYNIVRNTRFARVIQYT